MRSFDLVCQRSPACRSLGDRSMVRITALLDRLRRAPVSGYAHDGEGDVVAGLRLDRPGHAAGRALLRWNERANDARVTIRALIDNRAVVASRPAA